MLGEGVAGERAAAAADEDLQRVAGLAGLPRGGGHRLAVAEHRERAEGADRDPGALHPADGLERAGDPGGVVADAEGAEPLPGRLLGDPVAAGPGAQHLVGGEPDGVAGAVPQGGGLLEQVGGPGRLDEHRLQLEPLGQPAGVVTASGLADREPRELAGGDLVAGGQADPARGEQRLHLAERRRLVEGLLHQPLGLVDVVDHERPRQPGDRGHQHLGVAGALAVADRLAVGGRGLAGVAAHPAGVADAEHGVAEQRRLRAAGERRGLSSSASDSSTRPSPSSDSARLMRVRARTAGGGLVVEERDGPVEVLEGAGVAALLVLQRPDVVVHPHLGDGVAGAARPPPAPSRRRAGWCAGRPRARTPAPGSPRPPPARRRHRWPGPPRAPGRRPGGWRRRRRGPTARTPRRRAGDAMSTGSAPLTSARA